MPDDAPILTAADATVKLAEMTAAYRGTPPSDPAAQLEQLTSDPEWRAKFEAGDVDTRRQFQELTAAMSGADKLEAVLSGQAIVPLIEVTNGDELSTGRMISAVNGLQEKGFGPTAIREVLTGKKFSAEQVNTAIGMRAAATSDPAWVNRFFANDPIAAHDLALWSGIISAGVDEAQA